MKSKKKKGSVSLKINFENQPVFKGSFVREEDLEDTMKTLRRKLF
jgi:hypothetical protein